MTDFPGTQPSFVQLQDDPDGDAYEANQVNVVYNEIEALAAHLGAGTPVAAGGGNRLTLADGANTVGYTGQKAVYGLAGTPQTVIPGGAYDVTAGLIFAGIVKPSSGNTQGGVDVVLNGETVTIYEDGANIVTLTINAGGDAVVTRSAGSLTYNIILAFLGWI